MARPPTTANPETATQAQLAAQALLALARAARSLVLYDAGNAIIRLHLAEYHAKMTAAVQSSEMAVSVSPFQFAVGGTFVLEDRDREKSLPFKLYRDGIRMLRFRAGTPWEELLGLLRIVAIRYSSVRQQEEDIVTLIRRADFQSIHIDTIEGFAQVEEYPEPDASAEVERAPAARPPSGWDLPLQKLPAPGELAYHPIADDALAELDEGDDEESVASLSLSVASDLLTEATRSAWPAPNPDMAAFFAELRDALLIDGELSRLRELVDLLASAGSSDLRDQMLRGLADTRTLELILATVKEDAEHLPSELAPFLVLLGVHAALDQLASATHRGRRSLLTKLVVARLPRETDAVLGRLATFDPVIVRELADGIVTRAPERSPEVARALLAHADESLRIEGLNVVEKTTVRIPLRPLCDLLRDRSEAVRVRAAEVIGARGDESVVEALSASLEEVGTFTPPLPTAVGRALATAAPSQATRLFTAWIEPKGRFLVGLSAAQRAQQWAAVAGMGILPGAVAEGAVRALAEKSDGDLRRHCLSVLARRRRGGEGRG